jgi:hypothetical protein
MNQGADAGHGVTVRRPHAKRSVLLRLDNFHKECKRAGLVTPSDVARALHIDTATLWRTCQTGRASSDFVVGALTVLWKARFDDLFRIPESE